jgi:hypothetical protein
MCCIWHWEVLNVFIALPLMFLRISWQTLGLMIVLASMGPSFVNFSFSFYDCFFLGCLLIQLAKLLNKRTLPLLICLNLQFCWVHHSQVGHLEKISIWKWQSKIQRTQKIMREKGKTDFLCVLVCLMKRVRWYWCVSMIWSAKCLGSAQPNLGLCQDLSLTQPGWASPCGAWPCKTCDSSQYTIHVI